MLGNIVSGLASVFGGFLNKSSADENNRNQMMIAQQNMAQQREFAQQGIRWRVDDAKAAGIHPLYALGANTTSFSPVSYGGSAESSMGDAVANAGQSFGRAVEAGMTRQERSVAAASSALALEKAQLENDLLRTELFGKRRAMLGPAMPALGDAGVVPGTNVPLPVARPLGSAHTAMEWPGVGKFRTYNNPNEMTQDDLEKTLGEPADMYGFLKILRDWSNSIDDYHRGVGPAWKFNRRKLLDDFSYRQRQPLPRRRF